MILSQYHCHDMIYRERWVSRTLFEYFFLQTLNYIRSYYLFKAEFNTKRSLIQINIYK